MFIVNLIIFSLLPLGTGFALAVMLREMYLQQAPHEEIGEEIVKAATEEPVAIEDAPDAPAEDEDDAEDSEDGEDVQDEAPPPTGELPTVEAAEPESEPEPEPAPKNPFDDLGLLPKSFKVDAVLQDMLDENDREPPTDLSDRLDEEEADQEERFEAFEDQAESFESEDDEILQRALEHLDADGGSEAPPLDFDASADEEYSPMAVELLGEDFDFDALLKPGEQAPETPCPAFPARELDGGVFQAESVPCGSAADMPELAAQAQDIVVDFPESLVRDAVVEPDLSEAARELSFVEESRPMFVRRGK